ncbi:hypothetical protein DL240_00745 [Lujinxingia litoralis]|uniref:DUF3352 domain-containing protein n=1 Tax=Lujinxingia litoralis TaxID=2211119 RepID=A0A328CB53_9DELT|nr:hypothetical protein [Lujinxingia litoralis]RAL24770.1 hypothetical protein DL240_00745 [Lujinxingia litoralis]
MKRYFLFLLALLALAFAPACDGCKSKDAIPPSAQARITQLAEHLPATTEAAFIAPQLDKSRQALDLLMRRTETFSPAARMLETQVQREWGLKLNDAESWKRAGITPDGALMIAMVVNRPVIVTYVADRQAFEGTFIERLRQTFEIEEPVRNEKIGDTTLKISGQSGGMELAWQYKGNIAFVTLPAFDAVEALENGTALAISSQIDTTTKETSLASTTGFIAFRDNLAKDSPLSLYVEPNRYLARLEQSPSADAPPYQKALEQVALFSKGNANGTGLAIDVLPTRIQLKSFASGDPELTKQAREAYLSDYKADWANMLTKNTMLGVRTSFDLAGLYQTFINGLPEENQRALRRNLVEWGRNVDVNVEEDIINALSGHSLIAFYGIGTRQLMGALGQGNAFQQGMRVLSASGLMISAGFSDQRKMESLLDRLAQMATGHAELRPVNYKASPVEDARVLAPANLDMVPARLFQRGDTLTLAAAGMGEDAVYEYLSGKRDEPALKDVEGLDLGARFASADNLNGLYFNFERLRDNFGAMPMIGNVIARLDPLQELLLEVSVEDHGLFATFSLDFVAPLPEPSAQADAPTEAP